MIKISSRNTLRRKRYLRLKKKMFGTEKKPRISVYKSNKYVYAQALDDLAGRVVAYASSIEKSAREQFRTHPTRTAAKWVGEKLGERLAEKKIKKAIFDRSGYPYHGVVKELADAARSKGLEF